MPTLPWQTFLSLEPLIFLGLAFGGGCFAAAQQDRSLRSTGLTLLAVALFAMFEWPGLTPELEAVATDLVIWGALMYVAVRRGPNWSLFMAAWVFVSLMTSVVLVVQGLEDPNAQNTLILGRMFWYLALGSLIAGTIAYRSSTRSPQAAQERRLFPVDRRLRGQSATPTDGRAHPTCA